MNSEALFGMALGLQIPWEIEKVEFLNTGAHDELHITIEFTRGHKFPDQNGNLCPVHDTVERTWQHLNFFEHPCHLHCRVPRIKLPEGKVKTVSVPLARQGSGFTLLFEALAMQRLSEKWL